MQISVRVPALVCAQFQREAEGRCEDLATTVRRHLSLSLARDEIEARLGPIQEALEGLAGSSLGERLDSTEAQLAACAEAALDMERKLSESVSGVARMETKLQRLADVYNQVADFLNNRQGR